MTYACLLCGHRDPDVRMGLVRWSAPAEDDRIFDAIPRCTDRIACRSRVELDNKETWPLVDATTATWIDRPAIPAPAIEPRPAEEPAAEPVDVAWL